MSKTPLHILQQACDQWPDNRALASDGAVLTFRAFREKVDEMASEIASQGLGEGDLVPLCISDYGRLFISMFACWAMKAVPIPINMSIPVVLREQLFDIIGVREGVFPDLDREYGVRIKSVSAADKQRKVDQDTGMILFTSGSTGTPKGVVCTKGMLWSNAILMGEKLDMKPQDCIFINTPPYYTSAICHLVTAFSRGASVACRSGFLFGEDLLAAMEETNSTGFGGAPAHLLRILEAVEAREKAPEFSFLMSSGDHLPVDIIDRIQASMKGVRLFVVYGLSEAGGRLCVLAPEQFESKRGSVGRPISDVEIAIINDDGRLLESGQSGEVVVSGELFMKEYFNNAAATDAAFGEFGFHTGDIGWLDDDGFLYIEGRKDDIFKSGGEKVSLKLLEMALRELDVFCDVAAIAAEDKILGKTPVAFVVMKPSAEFKRSAIIRHLKQAVPHTHIPRQLISIESIPRTGSGKVVKKELHDMLGKKRK